MDSKFTYQIYPHRPIKTLFPGRVIFKPEIMQLTKDEAIECIAYGPVYRLMKGESPIRVNGDNINQIHRESLKAISIDNTVNNTETVVEPQIQETVVEEDPKTEEVEESVVEEIVDDTETTEVVADDSVVEDTPIEEVELVPEVNTIPVEDDDDAEIDEVIADETTTEDTPVEEVKTETVNNTSYNKKKHKK